MQPEPTTPGNALAHAFLALVDASASLIHEAERTCEAEDLRRITGIAGPDWLTAGLWHAVEAWRDTLAEVEPFMSFIGAALAAAPMALEDADDAQTLAALSAPARPFEAAA